MMWYCKCIGRAIFGNLEKEVVEYLNKLNDNAIDPEHIRITFPNGENANIFYYSDKEIK